MGPVVTVFDRKLLLYSGLDIVETRNVIHEMGREFIGRNGYWTVNSFSWSGHDNVLCYIDVVTFVDHVVT